MELLTFLIMQGCSSEWQLMATVLLVPWTGAWSDSWRLPIVMVLVLEVYRSPIVTCRLTLIIWSFWMVVLVLLLIAMIRFGLWIVIELIRMSSMLCRLVLVASSLLAACLRVWILLASISEWVCSVLRLVLVIRTWSTSLV